MKNNFLPFRVAREFVRGLGFKEVGDWVRYCTSKKNPAGIPENPGVVYFPEWIGWEDWLFVPPKQVQLSEIEQDQLDSFLTKRVWWKETKEQRIMTPLELEKIEHKRKEKRNIQSDTEKQIIELSKQNITCAAIASKLNIDKSVVYKCAKKHSIVLAKPLIPMVAKAKELYLQGIAIDKIASALGVCVASVHTYLNMEHIHITRKDIPVYRLCLIKKLNGSLISIGDVTDEQAIELGKVSIDKTADLFDTTPTAIKRYIKQAKTRLRKEQKNVAKEQRDIARGQKIETMVEQGFNYAQIGTKFGVTRERIRQCAQQLGIKPNREAQSRLQIKLRVEEICNQAGIVDTINKIKHLSWAKIAKHLKVNHKICQQVFAQLNIHGNGTRSAAPEQRRLVYEKIDSINRAIDKMPWGAKIAIARHLYPSTPWFVYGIFSSVIRNRYSVAKLNQIADAIVAFLETNSHDKDFQPLRQTMAEQIMELVKQNMTGIEIAGKLGISANAVWRCAKKRGVVVNTKSIDNKQIIELAKQGMTCAEIANKIDLGQGSVYRRAREIGVVFAKTARMLKIAKAKELANKGLTIKQIAAKIGMCMSSVYKHTKHKQRGDRNTFRNMK